jgi:hypothetical protein
MTVVEISNTKDRPSDCMGRFFDNSRITSSQTPTFGD